MTAFDNAFFFEKINLYDSYFENIEGLFEILKAKPKYLNLKNIFLTAFRAKIPFFRKLSMLANYVRYKHTFLRKMKYRVEDFRFRLGEKSATRYPVINRMIKDAWYLYDFKGQHPTLHFLWNLTSKCGQSLSRWAILSLLIALLFGAIYADYTCPSWLKWLDYGNWLDW